MNTFKPPLQYKRNRKLAIKIAECLIVYSSLVAILVSFALLQG